MTRPDRPYRFTVVYPNATSHWDYATKEDRAAATLGVDGECTTVTSRKPVKPGTPVCWVNVYAERNPAAHRTKAFADSAASTATLSRLHCIPVYLPGEGAEPVTEQMREAAVGYYLQHQKDRQRMGELESEVERLKTALTETMAQRDAARAEVARLTAELAEARVTWGSAEIASLRKLYAAAMEVRSWFYPPKHAQDALIRAVHDHAEKFGKPTEQP